MTRGERAEIVKECRGIVSKFPDRFNNDWLVRLAMLADLPGPIKEFIQEVENERD